LLRGIFSLAYQKEEFEYFHNAPRDINALKYLSSHDEHIYSSNDSKKKGNQERGGGAWGLLIFNKKAGNRYRPSCNNLSR
jgi:hypothetical protein